MTRYTRILVALLLASILYSCEDTNTVVKPNQTPQSTPPSQPSQPMPPSVLPECGSHVITGYTNKMSYYPGEEVEIFLQPETVDKLSCGIGFYDVNGKLVFNTDVALFNQPSVTEPWKYGFHFDVNAKVILPQSLPSGVYLIEKKISIIVKSVVPADLTIVYPSNTINAYNAAGGKSLYSFNSTESMESAVVSFLRPMDSPTEKEDCIECLKWLPSLSYKTNYVVDMDLDNYSSFHSKIIMIIGHSEYWTRKARTNFDRFVNEGGHAIVLSGNTMWWQVRYTDDKNALICYRSSQLDPETDESLKTVLWRNPILQYPILASIGEDFDGGGYGLRQDMGWNGFKIFSPTSPLFQGLSIKKGDILEIPSNECDGAPIKAWDADGFPILDRDQIQAHKVELIGFDRGTRGNKETFPTFIVMQKTPSSGLIVNAGVISWCSAKGIGSQNSGDKIKTITKNAIDKLLTGEQIFSD